MGVLSIYYVHLYVVPVCIRRYYALFMLLDLLTVTSDFVFSHLEMDPFRENSFVIEKQKKGRGNVLLVLNFQI